MPRSMNTSSSPGHCGSAAPLHHDEHSRVQAAAAAQPMRALGLRPKRLHHPLGKPLTHPPEQRPVVAQPQLVSTPLVDGPVVSVVGDVSVSVPPPTLAVSSPQPVAESIRSARETLRLASTT